MSWYDVFVSNRNNPYKWDNIYNNYLKPFSESIMGYTQKQNTQNSLNAQISYEEYLRAGNERALADWNRNVGSKGRTIRYPEFTYPGQIYRANTSIARAGFDYNTADANYYGNFPYRAAGLYGIASRLTRSL